MKKYLFLLLSLIMLSCATYKAPKYKAPDNFDKSRTYNKNFDEVWGKIIKYFAEKNIPIKTIEKASGIIATEYSLNTLSNKDCLDCGEMGFGQSLSDYTGNFNVFVEKINENQTKVTVSTFFNAMMETVILFARTPSYRKIDCNSTGILEKDLLYYIEK